MPRAVAAIRDRGGNEPYSDSNAPGTLERTITAALAAGVNPPAGESVEWSVDGKSLDMRAPDGTTTRIGPSAPGGGTDNFPLIAVLLNDYSTNVISLAGVPNLTLTLEASKKYLVTVRGLYTGAATTTGCIIGLAGTSVAGLTAVKLGVGLQTSTTAVTRSQITAGTGTATAATSGGLVPGTVDVLGVLTTGVTGGTLMLSFASEVAASAAVLLAGTYIQARPL